MSSEQEGHTLPTGDAQDRPSSDATQRQDAIDEQPKQQSSPRAPRPHLSDSAPLPRPNVNFAERVRSPSGGEGPLSPTTADRVFPIRSVVSVDPTPTPSARPDRQHDSYFQNASHARRQSTGGSEHSGSTPARSRQTGGERARSPRGSRQPGSTRSRQGSTSTTGTHGTQHKGNDKQPETPISPSGQRQIPQVFNQIVTEGGADTESDKGKSERPTSVRSSSVRSVKSSLDETGPLVTARFKHVVTEGGHAIITGRDGETLQRCEDEPIHIPGAVQGFGLLIALEEEAEGRLIVRVVSENSKRMIGYTPKQLFALESFTDILSEEQADNLLDHVDFIRDEDADVTTNGPEVFTMSIRSPQRKSQKLWCAMHINERHSHLIICEFELEDDPVNPLVPPNEMTPEPPEDTLNSQPTNEELAESTQNFSKPLRVLRSARKRKGEAAAMEVFNIMSQVQEQLAAAPNLERFLKILVGVVKELTGFHRVMVYQFDSSWNGRVVTELVDPRATKDLYKGLNFPASDIPKQARELYKINKVRMLYDRDQETARLVCRTVEDLEQPLDLTYSYLRAMSPIHVKYLTNMAVRSSMSISINAFEELWGLISCHSYGSRGTRVSFPIRKMCRLVGDSASRNIERLSYASRLQARKLINTVPTSNNPSGYIIASSEDLLKLFDADFGLLSIRDETKILGHLEESQEALAMLEYLRMRCITSVTTSQDIRDDFPDLRYAPGFTVIAGLLLVPLSVGGQDFIVFFRKGQMKEVKWAGNPYEKFVKEGTEGYLEPRKSFKTWSETVVGKCREWTEEEIETAAVLCLVYGKFIEVWRQKEAALQNSQLTRLLLANSAHEVRTPLNAIINYLEIALEGSLDQETRDNLAKSHSASKSLIYVINDLLDLTKTEEGGDLTRDEVFELKPTLLEATDMFKGDARRKGLTYEVVDGPGLPKQVIGDGRRVRQAISNVTANAIQNTTEGGIRVEMYLASRDENHVEIEISIADTGVGMNAKKLDSLFRELEQVQSEGEATQLDAVLPDSKGLPEAPSAPKDGRTLGLGLAVVARIVRNMNGQLRLKSEEGKGSRFVIQFPFDIPLDDSAPQSIEASGSEVGSVTPHAEHSGPVTPPLQGEVTLIDRGSATRRGSSQERTSVSRKNSTGSRTSRRSIGSIKSGKSGLSLSSQQSGKSEADRLIEAIQEPHRVEGYHHDSPSRSLSRGSGSAGKLSRPKLDKRHTTTGVDSSGSPRERATSLDLSRPSYPPASIPGTSMVEGQGQPIRPIRVPDDVVFSPGGTIHNEPASANADDTGYIDRSDLSEKVDKAPTADHMRVLVAEDDPVNSRIIKKRLEKLDHEVCLTVNGEECSGTYCDKSGHFDIILMDMQVCWARVHLS
jgi:light-regulated signal transduction histidine kinase (bacteriophytochrome)